MQDIYSFIQYRRTATLLINRIHSKNQGCCGNVLDKNIQNKSFI